ncbi:hypothetical protein T492DRAFT_1098828 [Pavlovales sp. CCMP2436]|nr:hypothetical protein T492DRAFT_1098828 [Pavlovales sp. CCMP2436]
MGKRDTKAAKGKREERRGKGAVKTGAKTEKANAKQEKRRANKEDDEDLQTLIDQHAARPKADVKDEVVPPPTPRANASLTPHPRLEELVLFGGEIFDGKKATLYSDLFRYNLKRGEWRQVSSSPCPPPRASHQAVAVPSDPPTLFVFGGEYSSPTQSQFYHYKDLWALDLLSWEWTKVEAKNGPSARSGHRMVLLKDKLAVFGGFFDNLRDVKYYNDLFLFDLGFYQWTRAIIEPGASCPLPRSGCQLVAHNDSLILFGGYFKKKAVMKQFNMHTGKGSSGGAGGGSGAGAAAASAADADEALEVGHEFKDMWVWDSGRGTWSTAKRSGRPPSQRSGFTMVPDGPRQRLICFGGVHDEEDPESESLHSHFYNDLHIYSLEQGKWFAPTDKARADGEDAAAGGGAAPMELASAGEADSHAPPRASTSNAAAAAAGGGSDEDELANGLADLLMDTGGKRGKRERRRVEGGVGADDASSVYGGTSVAASERDVPLLPQTPCPRMNAQSAVRGNQLYLWGGLFEANKDEVTMDDLWTLNMSKLDINRPEWTCLGRGTVAPVEPAAAAEADSSDEDDDGGPPSGEEFSDSGSEFSSSGEEAEDGGDGEEVGGAP